MRAGELRKRFRIEQKVENELDAAGHPVEKWKLFAKTWGELSELSASESDAGGQKTASASLTVRIRYVKGLDSTMRLCFQDDKQNRVFGIEGITKDQKNTKMTLACREEP